MKKEYTKFYFDLTQNYKAYILSKRSDALYFH